MEQRRLERFPGPGDAQPAARGGDDDLLGILDLGLADLDLVLDGNLGVGPGQPVHPDDVEPLVIREGGHDDSSGYPLSLDLDEVALRQPEGLDLLATYPADSLPYILLPGPRHLEPKNGFTCHAKIRKSRYSPAPECLANTAPLAIVA